MLGIEPLGQPCPRLGVGCRRATAVTRCCARPGLIARRATADMRLPRSRSPRARRSRLARARQRSLTAPSSHIGTRQSQSSYAGLLTHAARSGVHTTALTVVRRDRRRRGDRDRAHVARSSTGRRQRAIRRTHAPEHARDPHAGDAGVEPQARVRRHVEVNHVPRPTPFGSDRKSAPTPVPRGASDTMGMIESKYRATSDPEARKQALTQMEKEGVEYVLFWFTDIEGHLKSFAITPSRAGGRARRRDGLRRLVDHRLQRDRGVGHDRDPRPGHLPPDAAAGRRGEGRPHDLRRRHAGRRAYEGDPRYVLRRALDRMQSLGLRHVQHRPRARVLPVRGQRTAPRRSTRAGTSR